MTHKQVRAQVAIAFALAAIAVQPARADSPPVHLDSFGASGSAQGQIEALWGIAWGPGDVLYVADEQLGRVTKFDGKTGDVLASWNVANAFDVATAPDGSVYVLRRNAARIEHYSESGALLASFGAAGSGDGQFSDPYGISVDGLGQVFVADTGNHRIQRLAADGAYLGQWGTQGGQIGELQFPTEVAADGFGNVFVCDAQLGRIYRFSKTGALLGWWYLGGPLHTPMTLNYGLAVDAAGSVYVTESCCLVDKYTPAGTWLTRFGGSGTAPGQFQFVMTLAAGSNGDVYVSDRTLCRVSRFGEPPVPAHPRTWGQIKATYR